MLYLEQPGGRAANKSQEWHHKQLIGAAGGYWGEGISAGAGAQGLLGAGIPCLAPARGCPTALDPVCRFPTPQRRDHRDKCWGNSHATLSSPSIYRRWCSGVLGPSCPRMFSDLRQVPSLRLFLTTHTNSFALSLSVASLPWE